MGETGTRRSSTEQVEPDFRARFATAYRRELDALVRAVAAGPDHGADAWDGYAANAVADACLESLDLRLAPARASGSRSARRSYA